MAAVTPAATRTIDRPARRTQGRNGKGRWGSEIACTGGIPYPESGRSSVRYAIRIGLFAANGTMSMVSKLDGSGRKILVIDDDLAIRVLLQAVLKRMRFDVELAEDGAVGLEKVKQNGSFDLILLDLMMQRVNGYE